MLLLVIRMSKERIDESDIMTAREMHGLERLDHIKYAVLERNGVNLDRASSGLR